MVQIPGKYKLVENKNFYEFLVAVGQPEETAKAGSQITGTLEVTIDGNKVTMSNDTPPYVSNLVVGEEVDEKFGEALQFKSTTEISGDVITVTTKTKEGQPAGTRSFTFSDSGLEVTISASKDGKTHSASRTYKRV